MSKISLIKVFAFGAALCTAASLALGGQYTEAVGVITSSLASSNFIKAGA